MHLNNYYKNVTRTVMADFHTDQYLVCVRPGLTLRTLHSCH